MRKAKRIPEFTNYRHLLEKVKYDINRFEETSSVYALIDCFLTLNAIPEWITKDDAVSEELKKIAEEKQLIMKGEGIKLDPEKIEKDLNQQFRLIRLFCNHAKHSEKKKGFHQIVMRTQPFPIPFPIKFDHLEVWYDDSEERSKSIPALPLFKAVDALPIIKAVYEFWYQKDNEING